MGNHDGGLVDGSVRSLWRKFGISWSVGNIHRLGIVSDIHDYDRNDLRAVDGGVAARFAQGDDVLRIGHGGVDRRNRSACDGEPLRKTCEDHGAPTQVDRGGGRTSYVAS